MVLSSKLLTASWTALGLVVAAALPAQADPYRLEPGDVLQFSIVGTQTFDRQVPVDGDGSIRLPIGGTFPAAGRTLDDVRAEVVNGLKATSYPSGADAQGNTVWNVVYPEGVVLGVAEYRPVYLTGDVLTPGAQAFRSGMTVRQAVAVAGGYSMFRNRQDYSLEAAGLRDEYRGLLGQAVKAEIDAVRIRAEVDGTQPDFSHIRSAGVDPDTVRDFERIAREQYDSRLADKAKERENISQGIENTQARIALLDQSKINLESETRNYEAEVARVEELLRQGLTQVARLNDAQRAVFLVATRSLETSAEVARLERELTDLRRELEKVDTARRMENLAGLQEVALTISNVRAQIERSERRQQLLLPAGDGRPAVTITRLQDGAYVQMPASEDAALAPGDTVELTMGAAAAGAPPEAAGGAPATTGPIATAR